MRNVTRSLLALTLAAASVCTAASYKPEWASLDRRPTPSWWTEAKFGIFIHWGPYAVPAYAPVLPNGRFSWDGYAEWYQGKMRAKKKPFLAHHQTYYGGAPYANFAAAFTARFYKPDEWADLFKRAGAKYVVLTSKHHDGYALWPSAQTPYFNSVALGSGRDLAGEFCRAMRAAGLKRGFYFSMLEYANALYPGGRDSTRSPGSYSIGDWNRFVNIPQLKDLVNRYEADIIWPDGEWHHKDTDWLSTEFLAWLYNESSMKDTVVANDRWGIKCRGKNGGHYTTEYGIFAGRTDADAEDTHPWEECRGIGKSFGYNRYERDGDYMSREQCIEVLVSTVAGGGNLLLNIGPTADGRIPPIMEDRLLAIGRWLDVNGEAIYASKRYLSPAADAKKRIYFTRKGDTVYMIVFGKMPASVEIPKIGAVKSVSMLGYSGKIAWTAKDGALTVEAPRFAPGEIPCEHAVAFKIER
jgi:alpha-L-fucosidase